MSYAPSDEEFRARVAAHNRELKGHPAKAKASAEVFSIPKERLNGSKPQPALDTTRATGFAMRGISWFWPGRFALGKLGLIGGLPDKGKGLISADIIARCTNSAEWPCGEGRAPQGDVIWFTAEDDIEDTVIPRLAAAGADLARVHIVGMARNPNGSPRMFNLATDLPLLARKIEEIGTVALVIIDPVSAYLGVGKLNNSSTTDVRGVLAPLTRLAEEKKISIIGIMHFNKKADVTNAMLRIADSLAYVAAARHVYVVVDDTEKENARLFVKAKNNLAPDKHALRFMVGTQMVGHDPDTQAEIWAPHVLWDSEHVKVTATEAMEAEAGGGNARAARREADDFLTSRLAEGPVLSADLEAEAKEEGISSRTLRRAKKELGVKSVRGDGAMAGKWFWEMAQGGQPTPPRRKYATISVKVATGESWPCGNVARGNQGGQNI
jgi:AAA domain